MKPADRDDIVKRYSDRLDVHGVSPKTLGWDNGRAELRFEILCSRWDFTGASVLDFGCGFGDLCAFLTAKGVKGVRYLGVDVNPRLIEVARGQNPKAEFICADILEESLDRTVDYVVASGVFNDRIADNRAFIARAFAVSDELTTKGFAANFLSAKAQYRHDHANYTEPAEALELCYRYSNNVLLRNDYMPFEFTVFADKATSFHPKLAVYEDYLGYLPGGS